MISKCLVFILGFIPADTKKEFSSRSSLVVSLLVVAINVRFWIHLVFMVLSFLGSRYPSFIYFMFGLVCNRSIFFLEMLINSGFHGIARFEINYELSEQP